MAMENIQIDLEKNKAQVGYLIFELDFRSVVYLQSLALANEICFSFSKCGMLLQQFANGLVRLQVFFLPPLWNCFDTRHGCKRSERHS